MTIVVNARNGAREFECHPGEKILHAGLRSGLELPYECATGTCGSCKARLVSGRPVSEWPDAPGGRYLKSEAELLMCQCVAHGDCALEIAVPLKEREEGAPAPRALAGTVRALRRLTHDVAAFDIDLEGALDFEAGQFALLNVPGIVGARAYSMVNFDRLAERLSFVVKKKPGGAVSEWLFGEGVEGTRLGLFAPLGHATAGGHFGDWNGHVYFGVRTARDGFFLDELEAFRARYPDRLAVTVALSDEEVPAALAAAYPRFVFERGFVHAVAGEKMQGRFTDVRAYVAGPPPMVDASLRLLLREARLAPSDIRYDKFS